MSYGYKAKTNASQVAIRDWYSTNAAVLMRVANGSTIEVGTRLYYDSDGTAWRQCAYGFQKLGYMMNEFITITDQTKNKYRMIDTIVNSKPSSRAARIAEIAKLFIRFPDRCFI